MSDTIYRNTVLSVTEAAEFLKVSESIVRRLIRERKIPFVKIEGRYLFYRPALEKWLENSVVQPQPEADSDVAKATADAMWNSLEDT